MPRRVSSSRSWRRGFLACLSCSSAWRRSCSAFRLCSSSVCYESCPESSQTLNHDNGGELRRAPILPSSPPDFGWDLPQASSIVRSASVDRDLQRPGVSPGLQVGQVWFLVWPWEGAVVVSSRTQPGSRHPSALTPRAVPCF